MQYFDVYVKIINAKFVPMDLPVDYVYRCNGVLARYMVANGDAIHCDSSGDPQVPAWPPALVGTIADGVTVTLDYDISMLIDSQLGLTVTVDSVEATITGVAASDTNVDITLAAAITAGQNVVVDYSSALGSIRSDATTPSDAPAFNDIVASNVTA